MKSRIFLFLAFSCLFLSGRYAAVAADFATVPKGSPLYGHLKKVSQTGWLGTSSSWSVEQPSHSLTRYEMALETAKAIFTVTAHQRAEDGWAASAPRAALRALRQLTTTLRPELQKLDIDIPATLSLLDTMLAAPVTMDSSTRIASTALPHLAVPEGRPARTAPGGAFPVEAAPIATIENPITNRLRLYAQLSALARYQEDPLSEVSWMSRSSVREAGSETTGGVRSAGAGAALAITDWLRLRTAVSRRTQDGSSPFEDLTLRGAGIQNSLGGGVDINLTPSLALSGDVSRINTEDAISSDVFNGTRVGGGLKLSAWRNRLELNADLARLIPQDTATARSTAAELNLGFNVSENWKLRLIYQQLFSPQNQTGTERVVAGGLSVKF